MCVREKLEREKEKYCPFRRKVILERKKKIFSREIAPRGREREIKEGTSESV